MTDKPTVTQADIDRADEYALFVVKDWGDKPAYVGLTIVEIIAAHREAAIKEAIELLEEIKQQCLFADDDGGIGVTSEPYIPPELFDRICDLTSAKGQVNG